MGFLMNLTSVIVVLTSIGLTVFINYPPPPQSPLLYQWKESGRFIQFNGMKAFYKDDIGSAENNHTLLCLHGFPTSSFDWYKMWPHLKRIYSRVVAVDFVGLGFSDKPRFHKYSIAEQTDLVESILTHLQIKDVHIMAHDYGDTVVQELLARVHEKQHLNLKSILLLNGGIFPNKHKPRLLQKLLKMPIVGTVLSKLANYYMFSWGLSEVFGENTQPSTSDFHDFWGIIRYNEGHRVLGDILSYIDERFENEDRWVGSLQKCKIPLHFIYGPSDPVNPLPFPTYYKSIIPKASIDVMAKDIGHYVQLEDPETVIKLYLKFLNNNHIL